MGKDTGIACRLPREEYWRFVLVGGWDLSDTHSALGRLRSVESYLTDLLALRLLNCEWLMPVASGVHLGGGWVEERGHPANPTKQRNPDSNTIVPKPLNVLLNVSRQLFVCKTPR